MAILPVLLENGLHQHVPELWAAMKADDPNAWADKYSQDEIEDLRHNIRFADSSLSDNVVFLREVQDIVKWKLVRINKEDKGG